MLLTYSKPGAKQGDLFAEGMPTGPEALLQCKTALVNHGGQGILASGSLLTARARSP